MKVKMDMAMKVKAVAKEKRNKVNNASQKRPNQHRTQ